MKDVKYSEVLAVLNLWLKSWTSVATTVSQLLAGKTDEPRRRTVSDSPFGQMQNPAAKTPQTAVDAYFTLSLLDPVLVYGCSICLEWYYDKRRSGVRSTFTTAEEKFLPAISASTGTIAWLGGSSLLSPHHREELYRLPLPAREPTILRNLHHLRQYFPEIKSSTEIALFRILDAYPDETAETLRSMMTVWLFFGSCHVQVLMRLQAVKHGKVALSQFPRRNFETLGVQRWVEMML